MSITRIFRHSPGRGARIGAAALVLALGACSNATRAEGPAPGSELASAETPGDALVSNPYGDFLAARQAERDFDADRAASLYARTLEAAPGNPALLRQALNQMIAAGRIDEAAKVAHSFLKVEPDGVIAGLTLAVQELRAGNTGAAEKRLAAMPQHGLGGYFVPLALAWTRVGLKDFDGALQALEPLAKLRGGEAFHDYHAALILDLKGDEAAAHDALARLAAGGYAGYSRIVELAGAIEQRRGDTDAARAIYKEALQHQPELDRDGDRARPARRRQARAAAGVQRQRRAWPRRWSTWRRCCRRKTCPRSR